MNLEPFWDVVKRANDTIFKELGGMSEKRRQECREVLIQLG